MFNWVHFASIFFYLESKKNKKCFLMTKTQSVTHALVLSPIIEELD